MNLLYYYIGIIITNYKLLMAYLNGFFLLKSIILYLICIYLQLKTLLIEYKIV